MATFVKVAGATINEKLETSKREAVQLKHKQTHKNHETFSGTDGF